MEQNAPDFYSLLSKLTGISVDELRNALLTEGRYGVVQLLKPVLEAMPAQKCAAIVNAVAKLATPMSIYPPPQPGPQTEFLAAKDVDIVIYGGAAGGGKTFSLLSDPLKYLDVPGFGYVVFRRTSPMITNEGGLWDESLKWYPMLGAKPIRGNLEWRFPGGATATFRHLQHADTVHDWQGSQVPWIGFDELLHFTKDQFFYMLSRNRSTTGIPGKVRATCNPGPGWVREFLAPWVDPHHPNPAKSGEVRYFIRPKGDVVWVAADYRDEDDDPPKSMTFIRSTIYDNQELLRVDPKYISSLKIQNAVQQARLLRGDWDIMDGAFFSNWNDRLHTRVPGQDESSPDPIPGWYKWAGGLDYGRAVPFCFLLTAEDDAGNVIVVDEIYEADLDPSKQAEKVKKMLEEYDLDPFSCPIYCDPSIFPRKSGSAEVGGKTITPGWSMTTNAGKHISDVYQGAGLNVLPAFSANTADERKNGWAAVREQLNKPGGLIVYKGRCPYLIKTIAVAPADPENPEDVDTTCEDHAIDALRFRLRARTVAPRDPKKPKPRDNRPSWMQKPTTSVHYA